VELDRSVTGSAGEQPQPQLDLLGLPTSPTLLATRPREASDVVSQPRPFRVGQTLVEMGSGQVFLHEVLHLIAP